MNGVSFTGGGGEGHRCSSKECWQLFSAALYRFNKASFLYILWAWTQKETSSWEDEKTNCSLSKWKLISSISDRNPSSSYLSAGYSHYDYQIPSGPVSSCKLVTQSPVWKTCCLKFEVKSFCGCRAWDSLRKMGNSYILPAAIGFQCSYSPQFPPSTVSSDMLCEQVCRGPCEEGSKVRSKLCSAPRREPPVAL